MIDIYKETRKIINLLKTEKIEWGSKYEREGYTIYIPEYDQTATLEDNLMYAETEITAQLYHMP